MMSSGTEPTVPCTLAGSIDGGFGQVIEQFVGFAIEHAITLLNGRLSGGLRQMTFPGTQALKVGISSALHAMRLEVPECFLSRWDDAMAQS
jgi:hypothetical protein